MTAPLEPNPVEYALAYAERGWRVFPCHAIDSGRCTCGKADCSSPGKHPRTIKGCLDASSDVSVVAKWWAQWPAANIGLATGTPVDGGFLIALDIDLKGDGEDTLFELQQTFQDLPHTVEARTGSGGRHLLFTSERPVPNSSYRVGSGIDVRGTNGYVIVAPSVHASGGNYEWRAGHFPSETPLAPLPAWLTTLATKPPPPSGKSLPGADKYITSARNNALASFAGSMRRVGADAETICAALMTHNARRCSPPLDEAEVKKIAFGTISTYPPSAEPPNGDVWCAMTSEDLAATLAPVSWICEGLKLAAGAVTLVGGYGFSGKSLALQSMALSVAAGRPVWGVYRTSPGEVVHLDYEQGRRLTTERYQKIAHAMGVSLRDLPLTVCPIPKVYLEGVGMEHTLSTLVEGKKLCIVDSFRAAFPGTDENDSKARRHLDMLTHISERTGCMFIVILHAKKPSDGPQREAKYSLRGSSAIFDAAQTVFVFSGEKNKPTRVAHEKCRMTGTMMKSFGLSFDDTDQSQGIRVTHLEPEQLLVMQFAADTKKLAAIRTDVVAALSSSPSGLHSRELAGLVRRSTSTTIMAANILVEEGVLTRAKTDRTGNGFVFRLARHEEN